MRPLVDDAVVDRLDHQPQGGHRRAQVVGDRGDQVPARGLGRVAPALLLVERVDHRVGRVGELGELGSGLGAHAQISLAPADRVQRVAHLRRPPRPRRQRRPARRAAPRAPAASTIAETISASWFGHEHQLRGGEHRHQDHADRDRRHPREAQAKRSLRGPRGRSGARGRDRRRRSRSTSTPVTSPGSAP